jgi:hypothetical protein
MDLGPGGPELGADGQPIDLQRTGPMQWSGISPEQACQQFQQLDQAYGTMPGSPLHHDMRCPVHGLHRQGAKHHMDGVTDKEDRQYEHIKEQYLAAGKSEEEAKELAARTVNKQKGSSFLVDGWTLTAASNTDLGEPEPKMDKSHNGPGEPEVPGEIVRKDVMLPIKPENRTEHDLEEIGKDADIDHETTESLPAASGDDSGFSTKTPGGKGDHTKTFPKGDQTNPVTRETMSSSGFPSDEAVRSALTRL